MYRKLFNIWDYKVEWLDCIIRFYIFIILDTQGKILLVREILISNCIQILSTSVRITII